MQVVAVTHQGGNTSTGAGSSSRAGVTGPVLVTLMSDYKPLDAAPCSSCRTMIKPY